MATIATNDKKPTLSPAKASPKAATPAGAGTKPAGAKGPGSKRDALALTFERWARAEKPLTDTHALLRSWLGRVPSADTKARAILQSMLDSSDLVLDSLADIRKGFGDLTTHKFHPPAVGTGALSKGDIVRYKPAFLDKILKMGADPALWSGTWKVTSVMRTDTGNLFILGVSTTDAAVGIGPQPAFQFERT